MTTLSIEEFAADLRAHLHKVAADGEELVIVRDGEEVARVEPAERGLPADAMFADLTGAFDQETADEVSQNMKAFRDAPGNRLASLGEKFQWPG